MLNVSHATADELVARYAEAARRHGEVTVEGGAPANSEADEIAAIYRELRMRGKQSAPLPLLGAEDAGTRAWAGAHALEFAPEDGEPVLTELAKANNLLGSTRRRHCASGEWVA